MIGCYTYYVHSEDANSISCGFGNPFLFFKIANVSIKEALLRFDRVDIYTDSLGKEILEKNVPLSRACNIIVVNYEEYNFDKRYWNFPKMITYSLQDKPFVHIDFDVIVLDTFVFTDTPDIYTELKREYTYESRFDKYKGVAPDFLICSGLIGGHNTDVFKKNFEIAKQVCQPTDNEIEYEDLWGIEEYSFTQMANADNLIVSEFNPCSYIHFQGKNKYLVYKNIIDQII